MNKRPICPFCFEKDTVKKAGYVRSKKNRITPRYRCIMCHRSFTDIKKYTRSCVERYKKLAASWYKKGNSERNITRILRKHGVDVTNNITRAWLHQEPRILNLPKAKDEDTMFPECPYCNKNDAVIKRGKYISKNKGTKQMYFCKRCKRRFKERDKYNMYYEDKHVSLALSLHNWGASLREIAETLNNKYHCNISYVTIGNWIKQFKPKPKQHLLQIPMDEENCNEIHGCYDHKTGMCEVLQNISENKQVVDRFFGEVKHPENMDVDAVKRPIPQPPKAMLTAWFFFDNTCPVCKYVLENVMFPLGQNDIIQVRPIEISNKDTPEVKWFEQYSNKAGGMITPTIRLIDMIPIKVDVVVAQQVMVFRLWSTKGQTVKNEDLEKTQQLHEQILAAVEGYHRKPIATYQIPQHPDKKKVKASIKVLSCKVPDKIYDIVDNMKGSHSDIVREAIDLYLEPGEEKKEKQTSPAKKDIEYILRPKPGYAVEDVITNPSIENSWIEVRRGSEILDMMPATDRLLSNPKLQPPQMVFIQENEIEIPSDVKEINLTIDITETTVKKPSRDFFGIGHGLA